MLLPQADGWRAMARHGLADLSPPEALHAMLELPTNRAEYVGVLQDIGGYPKRSPIGARVPDPAEVDALARLDGRWRAVVLLDDERALRIAAGLFSRVFVLDPYYDSGALLYAAWHDPLIKDEHSRRLAEQASLLVRAGPLLEAGTAVLAPDHLPGSWNPRPGWRRPRAADDQRQHAAWAMRSSLVLLYWADRLGAVVCTTRRDAIAGLDVALAPPSPGQPSGPSASPASPPSHGSPSPPSPPSPGSSSPPSPSSHGSPSPASLSRGSSSPAAPSRGSGRASRVADAGGGSAALEMAEPHRIDGAQLARAELLDVLGPRWAAMRRLSQRRARRHLDDVADGLIGLAECLSESADRNPWRLTLGETSIPDPALLIRRVLNAEDPERDPPLPRRKLARRPLCLVPASH